jgi:hypothetical protein
MATRVLGPRGSSRRKRWAIFGPLALVVALVLPTIIWGAAIPPSGTSNHQFEFDGNLRTEVSQPGDLDWALGETGTTTLAANAALGATNIKVASVAGMVAGQTLVIDTVASGVQESRIIAANGVGTAGAAGTGVTLTAGLSNAHLSGAPVTLPGGLQTNVIKNVARSIPSGNNTSSCQKADANDPNTSLYVPSDPNQVANPPLAPFILGDGSAGQGVLVCDGTISKQTPSDTNGYVQGGHEDQGQNPVRWNIAPASSPKKTDLSEVYTYGMIYKSPFDTTTPNVADNLLMIFDAGRLDTNGDFHVDFEMNQKAITDCGDTKPPTNDANSSVCQPRTPGDILVSYDSAGGGQPPVATVFKWEHPPTDGPCASSQGTDASPTDGGCYVQLTSPPAINGYAGAAGVFNSGEIDAAPWRAVVCDTTSIQNSSQCTIRDKVPANGNMEGYIDIAAFVPNFNLCPGFGEITARSRSSSGINASLQDTTGAIPVNASICGSIIVKKADSAGNALPGATFTFNPDFLTRAANSSKAVADGGTLDAADANNGYVCVDHVLFGSYDITETGVPAGYFGDSSTKTVSTTSASTCADRLDANGVPKDANDVDATFTNNLGSILIHKLGRNADGTTSNLGGATFQIAPDSRLSSLPAGGGSVLVSDNGTADTTHVADASGVNGVICVDGVRNLGTGNDYTVTESSPPSGWFGDTSSITVPVHSASKCSDRVNADGTLKTGQSFDATFTNVKGSILIKKVAKDKSCTAAGFRGTTAAPDCLAAGLALYGSTGKFATFKITPSPTSAAANLLVTDNGTGDANSTGGFICIDNVADPGAGNSYMITEDSSGNANYTKDTGSATVLRANISTQLCSARSTTTGFDATFTNTPLSKIEVLFTSSADTGVTASVITCKKADGTTITPDAGGITGIDQSYSGLPPNPDSNTNYTCTINIDP